MMNRNLMMKKIVLAVFLMMYFGAVLAGGDKVRDQNPVFDSEGTMIGVVVPLNCTQLVNLETGQTGWFCPDVESDD